MNKKIIRSFALLSAFALLLGGCTKEANGNNNNNNNPGSSEPQPGEPAENEKFEEFATSLDDAKRYVFPQLEKVDEEEAYAMSDELLANPIELDYEYFRYQNVPVYMEEFYTHREMHAKFYENDFMEATGAYEEKEYFLGTMLADESKEVAFKSTAIKLGNRYVELEESLDEENPEFYWIGQDVYNGQSFREYVTTTMAPIYQLFYAPVAGKYVAESGREFIVLLYYYPYLQSGYNTSGEYFSYLEEDFVQNILEIKDSKIIAGTAFYEEYVDHDLITGALLEEKQIVEQELQIVHVKYGELQPNAKKTEFVAMVPERGIADTDDSYPVGGLIYYPTMDDNGDISSLGNSSSLSFNYDNRFVDPTTFQCEVTVNISNQTEDKPSAIRLNTTAFFSALAGTNGGYSKTKDLIPLLGEKLGSSGMLKEYSGAQYLVLGNEVKTLKFTYQFKFDDENMDNLEIVAASTSTVADNNFFLI